MFLNSSEQDLNVGLQRTNCYLNLHKCPRQLSHHGWIIFDCLHILNLIFLFLQVSHKQGKSYSFFLSSEYERSQWVETLQVLQASLPSNASLQQASTKSMSMYELQNWITSCRKFLKTNMGSFLMRSPRDEPLLVGDLVIKS